MLSSPDPEPMFPLRDGIPSRRFPAVTLALIAVNGLIFLYQWTLPDDGLQNLFYLFGLVPARLSDPAWAAGVGYPGGGWFSFLSSMFLHGGFLHLAFNMWTLWIFGDNVEDRMGPARFVVFYLLCGAAAAGIELFIHPLSTVPVVGASGAIAGVMGAYLVMFPHSRIVLMIPVLFWPVFVQMSAVFFLFYWFLLQLVSGGLSLGASTVRGGVAYWAHIGGFVAGLALHRLFLAAPPRRPARDEGCIEYAWGPPR